MAELPRIQVLVDWRGSGMNRIANAGFEVDTTGWSTAAGINAAATSMTRHASAAYVRSWGLRVVCSGSANSGVKYVLPGTFAADRTYRARLPRKRVSGTTAFKATLGSLGTAGDRATTSETLADAYGTSLLSVDWTPSANRTDAQLALMANAAAALTFDTDHVEVYEALNDITDDVMSVNDATGLMFDRGSNFDGSSEQPGKATLIVLNVEGKYNKRNAASPLYGFLKPGRRIWARATYEDGAERVYGLFYGTVKDIVARPGTDLAEILCEDMLYVLKRTMYSASGADNITYGAARVLGLQEALGTVATTIPSGGVEGQTFYSFAPRAPLLDYLARINQATGSIHVIEPEADSDLYYRYTVRDRNTLIDGSVSGISEHFDNTVHDQLMGVRNFDDGYDWIRNVQRVNVHAINQEGGFARYWRKQAVPFTIPTGETVDFFVDWSRERERYVAAVGDTPAKGYYSFPLGGGFYISGPTVYLNDSTTLVTGARTIEVVNHPQGIYFEITATGAPFTVNSLEVWGTRAVEDEELSGFRTVKNQASIDEYGNARGPDIDNPYIPGGKRAKALARYLVDRYSTPHARAELVVQDRFPSQVARRIGQRINVTELTHELTLNGVPFVLQNLRTEISHGGNRWTTAYRIEEIPDTTPAPFIIGASLIGGTDVIL